MKRRWLWGLLLLATAALMVLIFRFSSQPGPESMDLSMGIVERILALLSIENTPENLKAANFLLRKAAHLTLYFLLGCGLNGSIGVWMKRWPAFAAAVALGAAFAATDEFHQSFTHRTASVWDVLLDACGVAGGALLVGWLRGRRMKRKGKTAAL